MWKKSGAWFTKEVPKYVRPGDPTWATGSASLMTLSNGAVNFPGLEVGRFPSPLPPREGRQSVSPSQLAAFGKMSIYDGDRDEATPGSLPTTSRGSAQGGGQGSHRNSPLLSARMPSTSSVGRRLPIPTDQQQQRLKTTPRPRITPSWVHDKVQSSMSIGSEEEIDEGDSSSSSIDPADFRRQRQGGGSSTGAQASQAVGGSSNTTSTSTPGTRRHHHATGRTKTHTRGAGGLPGPKSGNLQRLVLGSRNRVTDTGQCVESPSIIIRTNQDGCR